MTAAVLVPSILLSGCSNHETQVDSDPRYAGATAISLGCGGGIAGTYSGTTAFRDGRVERWVESATAPEDERHEELQLDASRVEPLFAMAERIGLLDLPQGQPSNWCCCLTIATPAQDFALYYFEQEPPEELRALLDALEALTGSR